MVSQRLLAGDIGGTTTRLLMVERDGDSEREIAMRHFSSSQHAGLTEILVEFLRDAPAGAVDAACLAVAGPVHHVAGGETVQVTNLPWIINSTDLVQITGTRRTRLINDFEAIGHAIPRLQPDQLLTLQPGVPVPHGTRAVLGAGTGLGQAILVWQDQHYRVLPTEGGHVDFGPTDALQVELARWLLQQQGRACYEDLLSGSGLVRLYRFLHDRGEHAGSSPLVKAIQEATAPAAISEAALKQKDPLAMAALDLFVRIYGAQAGNLALASGATGGVYVAGGIAPLIQEKLREGGFLDAFRKKGLMTTWLSHIPLHVVLQPDIGLLGALDCAGGMLDVE